MLRLQYDELLQSGVRKDVELNRQLVDIKRMLDEQRLKNKKLTETVKYYRNHQIKSEDNRIPAIKLAPYQKQKQFKINLENKNKGRAILHFKKQDRRVIAKSKKSRNLRREPLDSD